MSEKKPTSFNCDTEWLQRMEQENINRSKLLNDLLNEYFTGESEVSSAVKRFRMQQLQSEIEDARQKVERKESELENLQSSLGTEFEEAKKALQTVPREEDNPAIQNWANKLGMSPAQLIEKLEEEE